ncbi:MAG: replicative DNA helicase [Burkholderiaceae bacterium]|nr:replicative DNA helicase [Burkholderiaceae bacterium]
MDDVDTLNDQQPPHSLPAEQALIGSVLRDPRAYERVGDKVTAADFYAASHRLHWQAITDMLDASQPCDIVTLAEKLARDGHLADAGGMDYLRVISQATNTTANIAAYADLVRDMAIMRAMLSAAGEQVADVYQPEGRKASELLATAQSRLAALAERGQPARGPITAREMTGHALDHLQRMNDRPDGMEGVSTGWPSLDKLTRGLEPSSLVILAARPSMGKTTFGVQLAQQVAAKADKPVLIFSLEMSVAAIGLRMISSLGRIDHDHVRASQMDEDEWPRVTLATSKMAKLPLHIDDQSGLTVRDITVRSQRLAREHGGLSLIVIDYLGLIAFAGRVENQNLGIGQITAALKGLAKSLKVPVVLLSQLNRNLEQRPNKRPIMADLRDSGSIEQDADLIAFIYRDEVYHPDSQDAGTAELIIAKHRNGETGTLRYAFIGKYCRFDELAYDWQPRDKPSQPKRRSQDYEY